MCRGNGAYWLKGRDGVGARRGVVHGDARVGVADDVVDHLWHALEAAVAGAEVDVSGPVVGQVLIEGARRARSQLRNVGRGHRGVEGILSPVSHGRTNMANRC